MYITPLRQDRSRTMAGVGCRCQVSDRGLGADDSGDIPTTKMSAAAAPVGMGLRMAATVGLMFIPVVGWGLAAAINLPMIGPVLMKPINMIINPVMKMFQKATHYGDCMKWWNNSNIASMIANYPLIPIGDDIAHEYEIEHAQPISKTASFNESSRRANLISIYTSAVWGQPDLMKLHCAVHAQSKGENYGVQYTMDQVSGYFDQIKQYAAQKEYQDLVGILASTVAQKTGIMQASRETGLITGGPKAFQLPTGVIGISGGAMLLSPSVNSNLVINLGVGAPTKTVSIIPSALKASAKL
jgi:hypothetical protein